MRATEVCFSVKRVDLFGNELRQGNQPKNQAMVAPGVYQNLPLQNNKEEISWFALRRDIDSMCDHIPM